MFKQGFTIEDEKHIRSTIKSLSKIEDNISEKELRHQLYLIGVYAYRQFMKAGIPADVKHPALSAPKMVWDKESLKYVDERLLLVACWSHLFNPAPKGACPDELIGVTTIPSCNAGQGFGRSGNPTAGIKFSPS